MSEALTRYAELRRKVDGFFNGARAAQPRAFACRSGCSMCCQKRFTVLPVEAALLVDAAATLPDDTRSRVAAQADEPGACPFLIDDRCAVYGARPLICRSHGLALTIDGRIDHCPLNFTDVEPEPAGILDLERTNTMLVLVDRLYREENGLEPDAPRVAIESIARSTH